MISANSGLYISILSIKNIFVTVYEVKKYLYKDKEEWSTWIQNNQNKYWKIMIHLNIYSP